MIQEILSSLNPLEIILIIIEVIFGGLGGTFFVLWGIYDIQKEQREQDLVPINRWYRRPKIILGLGLFVFAFPQILNVIISSLERHGYLPSSIQIFLTAFEILSVLIGFASMVYVGILQVLHNIASKK